MTGSPAIAISGLEHWFGEGALRRVVLHDLDLEIERGCTTFLMGPSGCGKTTLLTLVGGLRSVLAGSVEVLGRQLAGASPTALIETRRRIGFVFQHHNLHRSLTVLRNVRMGLEARGETGGSDVEARCHDALQAVGIAEHAHRYENQISGGQKQRAAIARALVGGPELLLADEPTAALDGKTGREVIELMRRLADARGMTVLMVTHDTRILDVADRILTMEDGRVRASAEEDPTQPRAYVPPDVPRLLNRRPRR